VEIIPVIDLMGGIVVHARAGLRDQYAAIQSVLSPSADLHTIVMAIRDVYPFRTMYIADLDAISGQKLNLMKYKQLVACFPNIIFWVDAGITNQSDWDTLSEIMGIQPVLASETLQDISWLNDINEGVLSLDFKQGQFLGDSRLWDETDLWPERVIVMNLDYVGVNQGPDLKLLKKVRGKVPMLKVSAAGGVRSVGDIQVLEREGIKSVLIASALHDGRLGSEQLKLFT